MRRNALLSAVVPALTVAMGAAPAWAAAPEPTSCVAHRLPLPTGHHVGGVDSGSPDGRYLIGGDEDDFLLWHDRKITAVARHGANFEAVNNRGMVVGDTGGVDPRPAVLHGNTMTPLKGVAHGAAGAINASGVIVGTRYEPGKPDAAVRWSSAAARPVLLTGPRGYSIGGGGDLTDDGTVVATFETPPPGHKQPSAHYATLVWPPHGKAYRLPPPPVAGNPSQILEGLGVKGHFVAWRVSAEDNQPHRTLRYDLRTHKYDFLPTTVDAEAVNPRGWATGLSNSNPAELVLQTPHHTIALTPRWAIAGSAPVLSDDGRLAAGGAQIGDRDFDSVPLVWDCR